MTHRAVIGGVRGRAPIALIMPAASAQRRTLFHSLQGSRGDAQKTFTYVTGIPCYFDANPGKPTFHGKLWIYGATR
jgi:hypothetical protein